MLILKLVPTRTARAGVHTGNNRFDLYAHIRETRSTWGNARFVPSIGYKLSPVRDSALSNTDVTRFSVAYFTDWLMHPVVPNSLLKSLHDYAVWMYFPPSTKQNETATTPPLLASSDKHRSQAS